MIFDVIVVLVVFFIAKGQSEKISKLEKRVKELTENKSFVTPSQLENNTPPIVSMSNGMDSHSSEQQTIIPDIESVKDVIVPSSKDQAELETKEEHSGKILGQIGIGAVLVGMAFFLKYAFDNNWIGPSGRVMIGIIIGLVFISLGQYLRKKYLNYSDLLMGGGIVILYLSIFAANNYYHLISPFTTYVFMFLITALSFVMSIINENTTISILAVVGGFATPFLVASSGDTMVSLFTYITILNIGVLGVSFFKKWPNVTAAALIGTAINFFIWYGQYYKENALGSTILFLTATFIIFLIASVARIMVLKINAEDSDYFIIGGNAMMFGIMLYIILNPAYSSLLGFVSVIIALVYGLFAVLVNKRNSADKALNLFLPGLTVVFLSIAVPLQLSGPWIATAWFVESCVLYYIASVMSNRGFQIMGILVYILGGANLFFWNMQSASPETFTPIFNSTFFIFVVGIMAAYTIAYFYKKYGSTTEEIQKTGVMFFVVVANILTIFVFSLQIISYYNAVRINLNNKLVQSISEESRYNSGNNYYSVNEAYGLQSNTEMENIKNTSNTMVSIFWALYAAILTAIGFARRISFVRKLGLALFVVTAIKVVIDVWSLGQLYRIVSFIAFGVIALVASFAYVKYKDRLVEKVD